jgi:hypothetical protein
MATQQAPQIDPQVLAELVQWKQLRDQYKDPQALLAATHADPTLAAKYNGDTLSPEAQKYAVGRIDPATGKPANGVNGEHFDVSTGSLQSNKGFWSLPESYAILAAAGALGGVAAAPFLGAGAAGQGGVTATASDIAGSAPELADAAIPGLASTATVSPLGALVPAGTSSLAGGGGAALAGGASTLGTAAKLLSGGGLQDILGAGASGLGQAANAAAQNRGVSANMDLQANREAAVEQMARAKEEQSQRNDALKQGYYANYVQNRKPGPFNSAGITPYGADTLSTAANLAAQSKAKLANAPQYDTSTMPAILDPSKFMTQYGQPSTLEKTSNWLSPTLSTLGKVSKFF